MAEMGFPDEVSHAAAVMDPEQHRLFLICAAAIVVNVAVQAATVDMI